MEVRRGEFKTLRQGRVSRFHQSATPALRHELARLKPGALPTQTGCTHTDLVGGEDTPTINEHLTEDQHARLAAELAELEGPKRAEVVEAIKAARAHGDLAENFEYHAAKNEQALLERRITILRDRLDSAVIVDSSESEVVTVGSRVLVKDEAGESSELEISSLGGEGTVSPASPLGAALLGRRVGETVDVPAPRGVWKATVIEIRPA